MNDSLHLRFNSELKNRMTLKIKPLADDTREEQFRGDGFTDRALGDLGGLSAAADDLERRFAAVSAAAQEGGSRVRARAEELGPRASALDLRVAAFDRALESALRFAGTSDSVARGARETLQGLEDIASDRMRQMVAQGSADCLTEIQAEAGDVEQGLGNAALLVQQMESDIEESDAQQGQMDTQLNGLSKTLIDSDDSVRDAGSSIGDRLGEIEKALDDLANEIRSGIERELSGQADKRESNENQFKEDTEGLQRISREYLNGRAEEWDLFDKANKEAQEIVTAGLDELEHEIDGRNLVERVVATEKRLIWCMERVAAWEKEDRVRGSPREEIWARLQRAEDALRENEKRIAAADGGEDGPEFEAFGEVKYDESPPLPEEAGEGLEGAVVAKGHPSEVPAQKHRPGQAQRKTLADQDHHNRAKMQREKHLYRTHAH
jgi:hypothetical protein